MCGLAAYVRLDPEAKGFNGKTNYKIFSSSVTSRDELFRDIGIEVNSRGGDGTGLTIVSKAIWKGQTKVVDDKWRTSSFRSLKEFSKWSDVGPFSLGGAIDTSPCSILHTRKASSGGSKLDVTHPIASPEQEILMSHNGTLRNWEANFKAPTPISDTAAIVRMMLDKGPKETFESLEGPMTCMWVDTKSGVFHVHRSEGRPLHYCDYEGFRYFASEGWMLYKAFDKNSADMSKLEIKEYPANLHTAWNIITGKQVLSETYTPKKLTASTQSYVCGIDSDWGNHSNNYGHNRVHRPSTLTPTTRLRLITSPAGLCGLRRGDWVIVEPYQALQLSSKSPKSKLMSILDKDEPFNTSLISTPLDCWLFNIPNDLADRLVANKNIKLCVESTGVSGVPTAFKTEYSKAITASQNNLIPIINWGYELTVAEIEDLRYIVQQLFTISAMYTSRPIGNLNDIKSWDKQLKATKIYQFIDAGLSAYADGDWATFEEMFDHADGYTGFIPNDKQPYSTFYKEY